MKTKLPESIKSIEEAKAFLSELHRNEESFHPEDSAHDIVWQTSNPTEEEKDLLDRLMNDIYCLPGVPKKFDSCGFLLDMDKTQTHNETLSYEGSVSELTFVKEARTENTGGNVMVDFLTLNDGRLLAISLEGIGLYRDLDHFDSGEDPISYIER